MLDSVHVAIAELDRIQRGGCLLLPRTDGVRRNASPAWASTLKGRGVFRARVEMDEFAVLLIIFKVPY